MSVETHTLQRPSHDARLLDSEPLEKLSEVQNFILFEGRKALVDCFWPFDKASDDTRAPLLGRSRGRHNLHFHGIFLLLLLLLLELTVHLVLKVLSLPSADSAIILFPLLVVDLRRGKGGNS
jgi:hypothetical protein